jgi:transcriptional antiterminator RfaH
MLHWYALFTKPRQENQVAQILSSKGIETYVPAVVVRTRRQNRTKRAFFPRYAFARINFDVIATSAIIWTPGLTNLVSFDNYLAIVPDPIIERMKQRLEEIGEYGYAAIFQPGDRVRVLNGPFKDFEAVFDKALSGTDRVRILLGVLGKAARYEIEVQHLARSD